MNAAIPQVLMFGWELPPHNSGGLGVACYGMTKSLSEIGTDITFILPRLVDATVPFMKVRSEHIGIKQQIVINSLLRAYMHAHGYTTRKDSLSEIDAKIFADSIYDEAIRYGIIAASWAQEVPHNLIHTHDWLTYPAGMSAAKVSGKPWIAHVHATEYDRAGEHPDTRIAEIEQEGLKSADRIIAVSDLTKRSVQKRYGIDSNKIDVVHNGVTTSDFQDIDVSGLLPDSQVVLFVGRLTQQKGAEYFLHAAQQVLQVMPEAIFVVVGSGDLEYDLIIQASLMGIADRVIFTGFRRGKQLASLFARADVFVMPSVSEPFGIVALEALATKKPIIVSRQSGVSEVIRHAFKADFWDTARFADTIISTLRYPELSLEMVTQSHKEMEALTWGNAAHKIKHIYHQLM